MALLTIRKYPDPILRTKTQDVDPKAAFIKGLVEDMFETMYAAEGVGLAANQVGRLERITVIDAGAGEKKREKLVLINPRLVETRGELEEDEGCLSFPKVRAVARRAEWAKVEAFDLHGKKITVEGDGLLGKALQHELDHLDGKLFIDKISIAQKALISGKLKDLKKAAKEPAGASR